MPKITYEYEQTTEPVYSNMIRGANVALIGGGSHVSLPSPNLDRLDLVVRINDHWRPEDGRMDVLYTACPSIPAALLALKPANLRYVWIDGSSPNRLLWRRELSLAGIRNDTYLRWLPGELFVPLTGVFAAWHLMYFDPAKLYITGMDFYYDEASDSIPETRHLFNLPEQVRFLKRLVAENPNTIIEDSRLHHLFSKV